MLEDVYVRTSDKLAIVGLAPKTRGLAPLEDSSWDVWTLNDAHEARFISPERVSAWFQIHDDWNVHNRYKKDYKEWLAKQTFPIFVQELIEGVPSCVLYPFDEIFAKHGRYFGSSGAYMLALAYELGYRTVGLWGFEMEIESEYFLQRPNMEYLIGRFEALGMEIIIPQESQLCKGQLYAFGRMNVDEALRVQLMLEREKSALATASSELNKSIGRLEEAKDLEAPLDRIQYYVQQIHDVEAQLNQIKGKIELLEKIKKNIHLHGVVA